MPHVFEIWYAQFNEKGSLNDFFTRVGPIKRGQFYDKSNIVLVFFKSIKNNRVINVLHQNIVGYYYH